MLATAVLYLVMAVNPNALHLMKHWVMARVDGVPSIYVTRAQKGPLAGPHELRLVGAGTTQMATASTREAMNTFVQRWHRHHRHMCTHTSRALVWIPGVTPQQEVTVEVEGV